MDELLDAKEVCAIVFRGKITTQTLCQYAATGKAPGAKIGKNWLFCQAEINPCDLSLY